MAKYTALQVAAFASLAGFSDAVLPVVVTIAFEESGWDSDKIGDQDKVTAKWGPSVGLMQIRSLNDPSKYQGVDALRVGSKLSDPQYNMNTAKAIYDAAGGKFTDWSTYVNRTSAGSSWTADSKRINDTLTSSGLWDKLKAFGTANRSQFWNSSPGQSLFEVPGSGGQAFWDAGDDSTTPIGGAAESVTSATRATDSLLKLLETIQNGTFWKRVGIYAAGYVMILVGILFLLLSSSNVKSAAGVAGSAAVSVVPGGGAVKAVAGGIKSAGKGAK